MPQTLNYTSNTALVVCTELEADIQTFKADLVQWICVVFMGQTTMLLVMLYFFVKYVK